MLKFVLLLLVSTSLASRVISPEALAEFVGEAKIVYVALCGEGKEWCDVVDELELKNKNGQLSFGKVVDITEKLVRELSIPKTPSIVEFRRGRFGRIYDGPSSVLELEKWMETGVGSVDNLDDSGRYNGTTAILVGGDETFATAFTRVAESAESGVKFLEFSRRVPNSPNEIRVTTTTMEGEQVVYNEQFDRNESVDNLMELARKRILMRRLPRTFEATPEVIQQIGTDQEILWLASDEGVFKSLRDDISNVAMKNEVPFGWLDTNKYANSMGLLLGVQEIPAIVYVAGYRVRYVYPESVSTPLSVTSLEYFLQNLSEMEPLYMSEEIPKNRPNFIPGEVYIAYGKTIESDLFWSDKDVLLLVYSPWDAFCRALQLEWGELAEELAQVGHVVVAKIDGTKNEAPANIPIEWREFPTILFVKAGEESPMVYQHERTLGSLKEFLMRHSSRPFQVAVDDDEDDEDEHDEL